jgi:hypothetical protein
MNNMSKKITEDKLYHGALHNPIDSRDYKYEVGLGAAPIDFVTGYDIRKELGADIEYLDQYQSYSCVGCATAYQVWIYQVLEMMKLYDLSLAELRILHPEEVKKISFKAIYSQISLGFGRGANIRDAGKLLQDWGSLFDKDCPSLKPTGTTDEMWVFSKDWITQELTEKAKTLQGKDYRFITTPNIETFATAIRDNKGVISGVTGINNGTWLSQKPIPPTIDQLLNNQNQLWGHALWFGAYGQDEFGNYVATPNSWHNSLNFQNEDWTPDKPNGYGWQKLYVDWFGRKDLGGGNFTTVIFNPMTFTDKLNIKNMILKKEKNNPSIYMIVGNKKIMIIDMPSLSALNEIYEEVDSLSQYQDGGTLIWVERTIY